MGAARMVRLAEATWCHEDGEEAYGVLAGDVRALLRDAHSSYDWQPIETAPRDGSRFFVFSERTETYDFANFDLKHGEFCKDGCGWQNATHWAALAIEARQGQDAQRLDAEHESAVGNAETPKTTRETQP